MGGKVNTLHKFMMIIAAAVGAMATTHPGYAQIADTAKTPVMLDIINGDTQFLVSSDRDKVWWITGECRREIPMPATTPNSGVLTSQMITDNVTIGRQQVVLEQRFRFNLTPSANALNGPISVEVYNSVRGGWANVPVRENAQCSITPICSSRMELPDC